MTYPDAFSIFSKVWFLGCKEGQRAKKDPKLQKKLCILCHMILNAGVKG